MTIWHAISAGTHVYHPVVKSAVTCLVLASMLLSGCGSGSDFDSVMWKAAGNSCEESNPRRDMVDDLMENRLKVGMRRREIRRLLGAPGGAYKSPHRKGWEWDYTLGVGASCENLYLGVNARGRLFEWSRGET